MRNAKPDRLNVLFALFLLLIIGTGQPWIYSVPSAFGREEVKQPEVKKDAKAETPTPTARTNNGPSNMPYTGVAEKNIFSPDRKEFPIFATPESVKKPPARPQVVLYGVTMVGEYQSASIVQLGRALKKGEREMLTLRPGEQVGEYRLSKIMPDRIVLEGEGDSFEVLLNDPSRPKQRVAVKTETKPATVTSALPGPTVTPPFDPTRPIPPTGSVPSPERVVMPTPVMPQAPPALTPGPVPTPGPVAPPTSPASPTYVPRRGSRVVPSVPGAPTPQPPGQSQGQGSP